MEAEFVEVTCYTPCPVGYGQMCELDVIVQAFGETVVASPRYSRVYGSEAVAVTAVVPYTKQGSVVHRLYEVGANNITVVPVLAFQH